MQEAFTRAVARWDKLARYDDPATWVPAGEDGVSARRLFRVGDQKPATQPPLGKAILK